MILTDCLSHFPSHGENLPIKLHHNIQHVHISFNRLNTMRGSVERDHIYNTFYCLTLSGCLDYVQQDPWIALHFCKTQDELTIKGGILLKGDHVCIHHQVIQQTQADLHRSHSGTDKMQLLTWETVYWPSINTHINDYVRRCTLCTKHKATQPVQSMLLQDIPEDPWQDIATDYLTHQGKEHLLICVTFIKYPFIYRASSKTACP